MQGKVAQIILDSCSEYTALGKVAPQMWYRRAAVAIDQAYEQKTARLQAQVVVMTEAIRIYLREGHLCDTCYEDGCTSFGAECECKCHLESEAAEAGLKEALSAAPKVVCKVRGKLSALDDGTLHVTVAFDEGCEFGNWQGMVLEQEMADEPWVTVLVLADDKPQEGEE